VEQVDFRVQLFPSFYEQIVFGALLVVAALTATHLRQQQQRKEKLFQ
jgi:hypothetical protein